MPNNFCFHVYAQKSLFMGEKGNAFFDIIIISSTTRAWDIWVHWAGSQLKMGIILIYIDGSSGKNVVNVELNKLTGLKCKEKSDNIQIYLRTFNHKNKIIKHETQKIEFNLLGKY